jgi:hypothetical protein
LKQDLGFIWLILVQLIEVDHISFLFFLCFTYSFVCLFEVQFLSQFYFIWFLKRSVVEMLWRWKNSFLHELFTCWFFKSCFFFQRIYVIFLWCLHIITFFSHIVTCFFHILSLAIFNFMTNWYDNQKMHKCLEKPQRKIFLLSEKKKLCWIP